MAKSPDQITLVDIYIALDKSLIANSGEEEVPDCSVEHVLRRKVASVMDDIERNLVQQLAKTTIGEIRE